EKQSGALRPPQSLSSREAYEVKAHLGELPEVFRWGHVRRAVDERWNAGLLCDRDKLFPLYFAFVVVGVEKQHHRGVVIDGGFSSQCSLHINADHDARALGVERQNAVLLLN